jgi:RNA polymerase sigma-70 factor (ECF subfamily)
MRMEQKIERIWQQVRDNLHGFIARRVTNKTDADDILQEVFLRIHRKLTDLKDPQRLLPWVYQITRHAIIDCYRAPARSREVPTGLATDVEEAGRMASFSVDEPGYTADYRTELARCLKPMIGQLAEEYREALTLVELEGLTQQAGAKRAGITLSGMKSRVQRGRKQLRRMLDECCLIQLDPRRGVMGYSVRNVGCRPCEEGPTPIHNPRRMGGGAQRTQDDPRREGRK